MADEQPVPEQPQQSWIAYIRQPLSFAQTVVGVLTGILTVGGTVLSVNGISAKPVVVTQGEIVAYVQDARSHKPLAEATVEILTAHDALVTTINVAADGRIMRPVRDGGYRLRVSHPGFITEVRQIEVQPGQRSDVRISLVQRPAPAPPRVVKAEPKADAKPEPKADAKPEPKAEAKPEREPGPVKQFLKTYFSPTHEVSQSK
jgi:hypothetical protein